MTHRICPQCKVIRLADKKWWGHDCAKGDAMTRTYSAAEIRRMLARATGEKAKVKWKMLLELLEGKK